MTVVKIEKTNDVIDKITLTGHAEFDEYGKDIVCASLSTMLITTVNACIKIDENSIKYTEGETFILENIKKDEVTNKLLLNLIELIKELKSKYKNNIDIKE